MVNFVWNFYYSVFNNFDHLFYRLAILKNKISMVSSLIFGVSQQSKLEHFVLAKEILENK